VKHIIVLVFFLSAVLVSKVVAASVLYVGDNITENIYSISPSGDVSTFASTYTGRGNSLPSPSALACDASGNLFYGTSISATITKINTSGQVNPFATIGGYVTALTFDPFGNLYAGASDTIYKITSSGDVSTFASTYTGRGNSLPSPSALVCDASGNLFYGTSISATITKINTSGQVNPFATIGGYVTALTFDPFGNLYAGASDTIYKITSSGDVSTFASTYTGRGNSLPSPSALACDASGNIYAGTSIAGLIYEFSPNGEFNAFATIGGSAQISALTFGVPEPSTYALFGLGIIGTLLAIRRRRLR
jgi:sugar lactone lactonase YvrE